MRRKVNPPTERVPASGPDPDSLRNGPVAFQPGQPFNPYGLFHGIFIPEALVRFSGLSPGAKIAYGRLVRYAGLDGVCHPRQATLAREIGVSDRQVRSYLRELTTLRFIRVIRKGLHAPNEYVFLWHTVFNGTDRKETAAQDRKSGSGQERKNASGPIPRESWEENHDKESHSSSSLILNSPPPTPSSSSMVASGSLRSAKKTDDDATSPDSKTTYPSERHELIALIEKASGSPPDGKLLNDILDRLKLRGVSIRAYLDDLRPRLQRLRRPAGPGFFYSMASEPNRSSAAVANDRTSLARCTACNDTGTTKTQDGQYAWCTCGAGGRKFRHTSSMQTLKAGA
jgi:helix-turn-helix protein